VWPVGMVGPFSVSFSLRVSQYHEKEYDTVGLEDG
jgi:hypothetical protein